MALLPFARRKKKKPAGLGLKPVPMPDMKSVRWDFGIISRTCDVFYRRFSSINATGYAIAHGHLRRRDMFDARRCFALTVKRDPQREDARYYLALSQAFSNGKHHAIGLNALKQPEVNGFPSFAEEAAYTVALFEDDTFFPARPPFRRIAEQEQLFRQHPEDSREFIRTSVPDGPYIEQAGEQSAARTRRTTFNESALLYDNMTSEDDAAMFLINVMTEYALPERTAKLLLLQDSGAAYAYMERKDMAPDVQRAVLPFPLPALIGSPAEDITPANGHVMASFDDIPAPEHGYDAVICPNLCRYYAFPGDLFYDISHALAPRALVVFSVPLMEGDDQEPVFLPGVDMYAAGENVIHSMFKDAGFEYIKTRRFTRRDRDMQRLLCVYRLPDEVEEEEDDMPQPDTEDQEQP